jgi:2-isopropylmalate synthase
MSDVNRNNLIYDWNLVGEALETRKPSQKIEFDDETLRDGLQAPSVHNPSLEDKITILHLMNDLRIDSADIGLPGAGPHAAAHVERLAEEIANNSLFTQANCAARTLEADIKPIAVASQKAGIPIEACLFIGSSPIRQYAEDWTLEKMLNHSRTAVEFAVGEGLPVMFVTEDTTRAHPDDLRQLYLTAIEKGAKRICLCDTVGHATPNGAYQLIKWARELLDSEGITDVKVDYHGHMDRGLGVWNTIAAIDAGADRVHGTALGIGERVGNTPMDILLVNLKLMGWIDNDLKKMKDYCETVAAACQVHLHNQYPVIGSDAFETGTGVHAAAVIKAFKKGDDWLANRVYSGVPADDFGLKQKILVGPMSGRSNVQWWLQDSGYEPTDDLVDVVFAKAKESNKNFTDEELHAIVAEAKATAGA